MLKGFGPMGDLIGALTVPNLCLLEEVEVSHPTICASTWVETVITWQPLTHRHPLIRPHELGGLRSPKNLPLLP